MWSSLAVRTHRDVSEEGCALLERLLGREPRHEHVHVALQLQDRLVVCVRQQKGHVADLSNMPLKSVSLAMLVLTRGGCRLRRPRQTRSK